MPKILIVEDEEYLAEMYKIKFEHAGLDVVIAQDGQEGLELAKKEKPDLMLLDLILPKMDGLEVLRRLRQDPATKSLKIYIVSNLGETDEIRKINNTGADGYFIKADLTPGELLDKVKAILDNGSAEPKSKKS